MPEATQKPQAAAGAAAGPGFKDPYAAFNFKVVIQGVTEGHFIGLEGFGGSLESHEYREGGDGKIVHHLAGRVKYRPVTLHYGLTASKELWQWFESAMKCNVQRRNVSIVVLGPDGVTEAVRYNLINAWPTSFSGAPLDALGSETAVEHCTLVYETVERGA